MSANDRIRSLLFLLDDPDEQVYHQVRRELLLAGNDVLDHLENLLHQSSDPLVIQRITQIMGKIEQQGAVLEMRNWKQGDHDILDAWVILSKIWNPELTRHQMDLFIDKLKLDAWLELREDLTSFEQVRILNHIFFEVHGFKGDSEQYHKPENSLMHKVLERKMGNPISLCIIYSLVAQRLNIPVYGVNLPQHFILGYRISDEDDDVIGRFNDPSTLNPDPAGEDVLFYINPFNNGLVFSRGNVQAFLEQMNIQPEPRHFRLCSNLEIVQRMTRNLIHACSIEGRDDITQLYQKLLEVLQ